jgi:hypothetical protein
VHSTATKIKRPSGERTWLEVRAHHEASCFKVMHSLGHGEAGEDIRISFEHRFKYPGNPDLALDPAVVSNKSGVVCSTG